MVDEAAGGTETYVHGEIVVFVFGSIARVRFFTRVVDRMPGFGWIYTGPIAQTGLLAMRCAGC